MRWDDVQDLDCSIARTLGIVGDRWTMLLVRELFLGTRRFEVFQENTGISTGILTQRLARLVDEGVCRKVEYQSRPARYEYRLTRKGVELYPIVAALKQWGDRHGGRRKGATRLQHEGCGKTMRAEVRLFCSACDEEVEPHEIRVTRRPAAVEAAVSRQTTSKKGRGA